MNSIFRGDADDVDANACVGNNGWVDAGTYADGYDIAVRSLCAQALAGRAPVDAAIYPIAFCARHRFELILKSQIRTLESVTDVARRSGVDLTKLHDLWSLWGKFTKLARAFDRRYAEGLDSLAPVIADFAQVDPVGQTFRYPDDRAGNKHLVDVHLVNIRRLYSAYDQADKKLRDIEDLTEQLREEYALGTRTFSLSRRDIADISIRLPLRSDWEGREFERAKSHLIERYGISRREFSKALHLIQEHREFCVSIGMELPLSRLHPDHVSAFCELKSRLDSFVASRQLNASAQLALIRGGRRPPQPSPQELECEEELVAWLTNLSDEVFAELLAVTESIQWLFCERYEHHYNLVLSGLTFERAHEQRKLARGLTSLTRLDRGLTLLGQTTLLSVARRKILESEKEN